MPIKGFWPSHHGMAGLGAWCWMLLLWCPWHSSGPRGATLALGGWHCRVPGTALGAPGGLRLGILSLSTSGMAQIWGMAPGSVPASQPRGCCGVRVCRNGVAQPKGLLIPRNLGVLRWALWLLQIMLGSVQVIIVSWEL